MLATTIVVPIPHVARLGIAQALAFVLVAVAAAFFTRRKNAYAVAALILTAPFDFAYALGPTTVTLPKSVLVGTLIGLALRHTSLAPLRSPQVRALLGGAIAIVAIDALTFVPAQYIDATARETLKATEYLAIFIAATLAYAGDPDETLIWNALGIVAALVCGVALVQEFTVAPSGLWIHGHPVPRIAGPLEGPNQLAGWLDLTTPMLAARALLGRRSTIFTVVATIAVTTDALTLSRSGAIALVVGLGFVFWFAVGAGQARRLVPAAMLVAIPLVVAFFATNVAQYGTVVDRFGSTGETDVDNGLATRSRLWLAALKMWRSDPGLGVGAGNFEFLTPTAGLIGVRTHANSIYLQSLAEGGILLFAAVVWTFVTAISTTLRAGRTSLLIGIAAATVALATHEIFDDLTFFPKVGELWWTLLGVGAAIAATKKP